MRKRTKVLGLLAALGGAAVYLGYPTRRGLTKAQAEVSMPGDLLLPTASYVADRRVEVPLTPQQVWPFVEYLGVSYEDVLGVPLEIMVEDQPETLIWKTSHPARNEKTGEEYFEASVAVTVTPTRDGHSEVMVRERYEPLGSKGQAAVRIASLASYFTAHNALPRS